MVKRIWYKFRYKHYQIKLYSCSLATCSNILMYFAIKLQTACEFVHIINQGAIIQYTLATRVVCIIFMYGNLWLPTLSA